MKNSLRSDNFISAPKVNFPFLLFLQTLHSHRSGFIPYSVKVASDRKFF